MPLNAHSKAGIESTGMLLLAVVAALLAGVAVVYWQGGMIALGLLLVMLLCGMFWRWGIHAVIWPLFCLSIPWTMVRVSVFGGAYTVSPAMVLALLSAISWVGRTRLERLPALRVFRPGIVAASLYVGFSLSSILWAPTDAVRPALLTVGQYLFGVFLYVLLSSALRSRRKLENAVRLAMVSCGAMLAALLYYYMIFLGRDYVSVWFSGEVGEAGKNALGYLASLFLPLMIAHVLLVRSDRKAKLAEWVLAAVYALALLFSTSRGSYVAAAFAIAFLLAYLVGRPRRCLLLLIGSVVLLVLIYQPAEVVLHLRSLRDLLLVGTREVGRSEGSVGTRIRLIGFAWQSFRRSPLWGLGLGSFRTLFPRPSHSDHLRVLAETGMVGFVTYLSLFLVHMIALIKRLWMERRRPHWLEVGLFGTTLSIVVRLVFFNADTFYVTWAALGFVASLLTIQDSRCRVREGSCLTAASGRPRQ